MPMIWVEPDRFLLYKGVSIYHTYNDGDGGDPRYYWFTTSSVEEDGKEFDVRDLASKVGLHEDIHNPDGPFRTQVLIKAIDMGLLNAEGIRSES